MAQIVSKERVLEYTQKFKVKIFQLTEVDGLQASLIAKGLDMHPVMRKGGVHDKSNGAKRKAAKLATRKLASESRCGALHHFPSKPFTLLLPPLRQILPIYWPDYWIGDSSLTAAVGRE